MSRSTTLKIVWTTLSYCASCLNFDLCVRKVVTKTNNTRSISNFPGFTVGKNDDLIADGKRLFKAIERSNDRTRRRRLMW